MPSLLFLLPLIALPSQELTATELSVGAATAVARETFAGGELGLARRTSNETRLAFSVAGGSAAHAPAVHAQVTLQLLLNSFAKSGSGLYAGLGAAFTGRDGAPGQGFVAALLGLEGAPGGSRAWYAEVGIGGGVRVAAGWRWRWFPSWWRTRGG